MTFIVKFVAVFGHVFYAFDTIIQRKEVGGGVVAYRAMAPVTGPLLYTYSLTHNFLSFL